MFDKSTIDQLSQLKNNIISTKDYAEGTVIGTNGRFGFLKTDDGRTAFINPERMLHVLPGDRVKALLTTNKKEKLEAELEELLESDSAPFVGYYKIKGNNHFVQEDCQPPGRWLFVPPQFRKKCNENDLVLAELGKHPFKDGKASAKIISHIGAETDDFIHHNRVIAEFGLDQEWSKDALKQAAQTAAEINLDSREDLTHIPFVTIDAPSTRDMDDAVYATLNESGDWRLWVAIADPSSFIQPSSPIAKSARNSAQSAYLPARTIPMLPEVLATDTFSLTAKAVKPALVICIDIDKSGEIKHYEFKSAKVESHEKLTYREVSQYLDDDTLKQSQTLTECSDEIKASLKLLYVIAQARIAYRKEHHIVNEDMTDYDYRINDKGLLDNIQIRNRSSAHNLIEEAMLSTNICAGEFLAQNNAGIFATHTGFREDRIGEVRAVLREDIAADNKFENINEYDGHLELIRQLKDSHLIAPLKRMMNNAEINTEALPHLSLGVKHYATISSPIRRYVDLCNHWSIHQLLNKQKVHKIQDHVLEKLRESLTKCRQASRQLELTLVGHYLLGNGDASKALLGDNALSGKAVIRIVTQQGFGVRLIDTGIEGFIQIPKKVEKTYDAKRMTLTVNDITYALDGVIEVTVTGVDLEKRRVKMDVAGGFSAKKSSETTESEA